MGVEINWQSPMIHGAPIPAVVYARYSSAGQNEQSIEGQLSKAKEYAAAHGYKIVHEYVDRAKTGRNDNREAFQQMLRDTSKRQFQVIILWKVDRFGRNREEIALNKYKCKKNGVRVEYVAENIPASPEGVILESVLEGMAEYFSLQLSQNVRRGQQKSAEKCQFTGGTMTLGYKTGPDKKFQIDPETAPAVKLIFEKYLAGATINEIVTELNEKGHRTMRGRPFTKNSIGTILRNEKYIGVYAYNGIRVEGGVPQIIDDETFYRVQAQLKANRSAPAHRWNKADYILTDKLFCGHCEARMIGESGFSKTGAKHCYYTCGRKKRDRTCKKKNIRQDVIEPLVIDFALTVLHDDELLEFIIDGAWNYYLAQDQSMAEIESLERQLRQVETAIGNLVRAIEMGIFNESTKARMDELTEQQQQIKATIAECNLSNRFQLTREIIAFFLYKLRDLDMTKPDSQKRIINTFINSIYLYDDHFTIHFNYSGDSTRVKYFDVESASSDISPAEKFGCCLSRCAKKPVIHLGDRFFVSFPKILCHTKRGCLFPPPCYNKSEQVSAIHKSPWLSNLGGNHMRYCIAGIEQAYRGMERQLTGSDLYTPKTKAVFDTLLDDYFVYSEYVDEKPPSSNSFEQVIAFYRQILPFDIPCEIIACDHAPLEHVYGYPIELLGIDIVHDECESLLNTEINPAISHLLNENGLCCTEQDVERIIPFQDHGNVEWKPYYVYRVKIDEPFKISRTEPTQ